MFRKLYWITEQNDPKGNYRATGVYTSVHDLIESGLRHVEPAGPGFRITLVKLDCQKDVLGSWEAPRFDGLEEGFQKYVETHEFSVEEAQSLRAALDQFVSAVSK